MTHPGNNWRLNSRCQTLTPEQADKIFFPKPGGKSSKAKDFCKSCPVIANCLSEALDPGIAGFFAGTTETERKGMRRFKASVTPLSEVMPPEPTRRQRRLKSIPVTPKVYDPLADVDGPSITEEMSFVG